MRKPSKRPPPTPAPGAQRVPAPRLFEPVVVVPSISTRQPDGSIVVRAGRPEVLKGEDEIATEEFARKSGLSRRHVLTLIEQGQIQARPLSPLPNSRWRIPRSELARYLRLEKSA